MMWLSAMMTSVTKPKSKHVNGSRLRNQNTRDNHSQPARF